MAEEAKRDSRRGAKSARRLSGFARRMLADWKRRGWPVRGERVVLAVSGGADSMAMLLAFDELRATGLLELDGVVAHLDHGLRGERGADDARWVSERARELRFEVVTRRADASARARDERDNLEQAARRVRYEFLLEVALAHAARAVLAAHTLDDQAETVLLRLLRGSGAAGLAGIRPERPLDSSGAVVVLRRPLLAWARRADTEKLCRERGVDYRIDETNEDERLARVRVRRLLLPLLESFNPRAAEGLSRTAELLHEDASALDALAAKLLRESSAGRDAAAHGDDAGHNAEVWPLNVELLLSAPAALRRRVLRQWIAQGRGDLRRVESAHLLAVEKLLTGNRGGRVAELPGGSYVERRRGWLLFHAGRS